MHGKSVILIGCGAQAKYAIDIFAQTNRSVSQVFDTIGRKAGQRVGDFTIESFNMSEFLMNQSSIKEKHSISLCVSNNKLKSDLYRKLEKSSDFVSAIHPECTIAATAKLGFCVIVNARAVIQPYAKIGNACMIHAGVVIEHDCIIGDFVNIAPGVNIAGQVSVGEGATIYTGAIVAPNIKIGRYAVIGAGSLVLNDIPDHALIYGSPAKIIRKEA